MDCEHELEGPRFRQPKPSTTGSYYNDNPMPHITWTCKKCDHGFGFTVNVTVTPGKVV